VLGNTATQTIQGYSSWGTLSDQRFKTNVKEDVQGLDFILKLRPVNYQLDAQKLDNFLRAPFGKTSSVDTVAEYQTALAKKGNVVYTGLLAQEVETAAQETGFEFSGVVKPAHENDHYTLRYAEFVVPLIKAVQEQQAIIEEQQMELAELKKLVQQLVRVPTNSALSTQQNHILKTARLEQNQPNPFSDDTTINYYIPETVQNATLIIASSTGNVVKKQSIQERGAGQILLDASTLSDGMFFYSLVLDGKHVATKKLISVSH